MVSIRFHDVYVGDHPEYTGRVSAYVDRYDDVRGILALRHSYETSEFFFYADVLFCADIQTIFIMDYYAFHPQGDEYVPHIHHVQKTRILRSVIIVLQNMYPDDTPRLYNKGTFQALQQDIQCQFRYKTNALARVLPWDIVDDIYILSVPTWTRHRRVFWPKRWDTYKTSRTNRREAKNVFYCDWNALRDIVCGESDFIGKLARVVIGGC